MEIQRLSELSVVIASLQTLLNDQYFDITICVFVCVFVCVPDILVEIFGELYCCGVKIRIRVGLKDTD